MSAERQPPSNSLVIEVRDLNTRFGNAVVHENVNLSVNPGEIFALVVYSQLILENAPVCGIDDDLLDQIFDFMDRDMSKFALQLISQPSSTEKQVACCRRMIQKAVHDQARYDRVWNTQVAPLSGAYEMAR